MAMQSLLAKAGLRSNILGSSASLAIAAPLANGNPDPAAHTDASRIGVYFDRTGAAEKMGFVVMGTEILSVGVSTVAAQKTTTATTALNLVSSALTVSPSGASVAGYSAGEFSTSTVAATAGNLTGASIKGINIALNLNSSVAATLATAACTNNTINVTNSSAASTYTLTNVYGFYQGGGTMTTTNAGASTVVTNYYGIYLAAPITAGAGTTTITNRYGIFQADPLANNVLYGFVSIGQGTDTAAHLTVTGGNTGGAMIRMVRTLGSAATFAWALTGGGLAFADETAGFTTTNIFGNGGENQLYIGQKLTSSVYLRNSVLSGTTFSGTVDTPACNFFIQSSLGTGAGAVGSIVFRTGNLGVTGLVLHTTTDRMTIQGAAGSAFVQIAAATTSNASLNLGVGVNPTSPVAGDMWMNATGLAYRIGGGNVQVLSGSGASTQIAYWSNTSSLTGNAGFTATVVTGVLEIENEQTSTATSGLNTAITGAVTANPGSASTATTRGGTFTATAGVNANLTSAVLIGIETSSIQSGATAAGTTVLSAQVGNRATVNVVNAGAGGTLQTSTAYSYLARPILSSTAGSSSTITTYYGLYIDQPTLSGAGTTSIGTRYGVFQVDPSAANVFAGATTMGTLAATNPQLIVQGGATGAPIIRLSRTAGGVSTFAWALVGGGLSFTDEVAAAVTTNIFGDTNTNFLYLGQRNKTAADTRISFLSGTTFGAGAGTDTPASAFVISGGMGYGTGAPGQIIFRTGVAAVSGSPHTSVDRLTLLDGANGFRFANATGSGYNFQFNDGSNSFRSVNSNSFSDVVSSTFFQTGQTSGVGVFTAQNGSPYSRSLYLSNAFVISAGVAPHNTATTAPPPTGVFEIHNTTIGPVTALVFRVNVAAGSAFVQTPAAITSNASLNLPHGVAPTVPVNGDMWTTTAGVFARVNGATQTLMSGTGAANQISYWTGTSTQGGNSGFTAISTSGALLVNLTQVSTATALATTTNGLTVDMTANPAAVAVGTCAAAAFSVSTNSAAGANTAGVNLMSFRSTVSAISSVTGSINWLFANRNVLNISNTGIAGTTYSCVIAYGFTIDGSINTTNAGATTTLTDYYGVVINTPQFTGAGTGTITNRWGVYVPDTLMTSFFGGVARIGSIQARTSNLTVSAVLGGGAYYYRFIGAAGQTITLPPANAASAGYTPVIVIKNTTAVTVNVTAGVGNTLDTLAAGVPITLGPSASVTFMSSGVSAWESN